MKKMQDMIKHQFGLIQKSKYSSNKQGSVLMLVLGVFSIFLILFVALSSLSLRTSNETIRDIERHQAYLSAKSVLQSIVDEIQNDPNILNNTTVFPVTTEAKIDNDSDHNSVLITINKTGLNPEKITITAIANVNEQTEKMSADFERLKIRAGGGSGWITTNSDLFKYVIASRNNTHYGVKTLQNIFINGDMYWNDEQFKIGKNAKINGNIVSRIFSAEGNTDGKNYTVNGNLFIKERMNAFSNIYVNGSVTFLSAAASGNSIAIKNSIITDDLILNRHNWHSQLQNSVVGGDVISLAGDGDYHINNSVVYGDVWFNTLFNNYINAISSSFIGGISNKTVSSLIKKANSLRSTNDFSTVINSGTITSLCGSNCTLDTVVVSNFNKPTDLPALPASPKVASTLPVPTLKNAFTCEKTANDIARCYLNQRIVTRSAPIYVEADIDYSTIQNPWNIYFDIDSNKIEGAGDLYFIFNKHKHYVFDKNIGDFTADEKPNLFFLMGSNVTYPVDIESDFNGYIYNMKGVVRLKGTLFNGAINSEVVQICKSGDDCEAVPTNEPRFINYTNPVGPLYKITFKGYQ